MRQGASITRLPSHPFCLRFSGRPGKDGDREAPYLDDGTEEKYRLSPCDRCLGGSNPAAVVEGEAAGSGVFHSVSAMFHSVSAIFHSVPVRYK